jgi:hypothetical protein
MEQFTNNFMFYFVIIIGIVLLYFLLKFAVRLALVIIIVGAIAFFVFDVSPSNFLNIGEQAKEASSQQMKKFIVNTIEPTIKNELATATYTIDETGGFVIATKSLRMEGNNDQKTVKLYYGNKAYDVDISILKPILEKYGNGIPVDILN